MSSFRVILVDAGSSSAGSRRCIDDDSKGVEDSKFWSLHANEFGVGQR